MKKSIFKIAIALKYYNEKYKEEYNTFFERHPEFKKEETTKLTLIVFAMFSFYLMDLVGIINIT